MSDIYFVAYELAPDAEHPEFAEIGGAVANCLIRAENADHARKIAQACFDDEDWQVVALETEPHIVTREYFADDPEWQENFDDAQKEGEFYAFFMWPPEMQEGDVLH